MEEDGMTRTRQSTHNGSDLSQAVPGYKGYGHSKVATKTDRVFSEEILSKLSEAVATVSRIRRVAGANFDPEVLGSLDVVEEKAESLAQAIAQTAYDDRGSSRGLEHSAGTQMLAVDSSIIERVGQINQVLAAFDLEGGAGVTPGDVESICDLLDDLKNSIRRRDSILNSKLF
jgi:hypothetical protein